MTKFTEFTQQEAALAILLASNLDESLYKHAETRALILKAKGARSATGASGVTFKW